MYNLNRIRIGSNEVTDSNLAFVGSHFPDLTDYGLGIHETGVSKGDRVRLINEKQSFLFNDCRDEIALSLRFLRCFTPLSRASNVSPDSYYMKHVMEDAAHTLLLPKRYVCNGAFIAAAVIGGFAVMPNKAAPWCVNIGVSKVELRTFANILKGMRVANFLEARDLA